MLSDHLPLPEEAAWQQETGTQMQKDRLHKCECVCVGGGGGGGGGGGSEGGVGWSKGSIHKVKWPEIIANSLPLVHYNKMHDNAAMHVLGRDTEISELYYIRSLEQVRLGEISKQLLTTSL